MRAEAGDGAPNLPARVAFQGERILSERRAGTILAESISIPIKNNNHWDLQTCAIVVSGIFTMNYGVSH